MLLGIPDSSYAKRLVKHSDDLIIFNVPLYKILIFSIVVDPVQHRSVPWQGMFGLCANLEDTAC